ncbi:hypothetical protein B0H17DRAFT_1036744 [Mycena rosella]|uniref:SH3 domain-binding glutamic acid-rich protein n=1 Tax=Mycena rosella TaxID=1033263 RepID=A0AAD7GVT3_MYCRO|nr:hypothetical protein B0H17DRAFT_1036744 [Mycena rosella]
MLTDATSSLCDQLSNRAMPSPPIEVFLTTIASQPALRQRQEYILRILQVKKIPFTSYDLASDEKAKRLWKRKAPLDKQQLPGLLVGGKFPGPFSEFEDAVECDDLDVFLRLKESWDADIDADNPPLPAAPIGVPGAMMPLQMTPEHMRTKILAQQSSPLKGKGSIPVNKRPDAFDVSTELSGFGLQGVMVSEDELSKLVAELGLDGDEASDLVKGLSSAAPEKKEPEPVLAVETPAPEVKIAENLPKATEVSEAAKSEKAKSAEDFPKAPEELEAAGEPKSEAEPTKAAVEHKPEAEPVKEEAPAVAAPVSAKDEASSN